MDDEETEDKDGFIDSDEDDFIDKAPGILSPALQEAFGIFGKVENFLRERQKYLAKGRKSDESGDFKLEDEFDPLIISEKHMTQKDDQIRGIDIPERMQILESCTGPPPTDEMSIEEESSWIYNQIVNSMPHLVDKRGSTIEAYEDMLMTDKDTMLNDISRFLKLMHVQKLDVPFIAMYRREECLSLFKSPEQPEVDNDEHINSEKPPTVRWHKDLDKKWLLIQKRKSALALYYEKRFLEDSQRIYDETRLYLNHQLFESVTKSLKDSESERERLMMWTQSLICISLKGRLVLKMDNSRGPRGDHTIANVARLACGRLQASLAIALSNLVYKYLWKKLIWTSWKMPKKLRRKWLSILRVRCSTHLKLCLKELGTWQQLRLALNQAFGSMFGLPSLIMQWYQHLLHLQGMHQLMNLISLQE